MRWDMFSRPMTAEALVPRFDLRAILQSCCRLRGLPTEKKRGSHERRLPRFRATAFPDGNSEARRGFTFIELQAGASGRRRRCVVHGFSSVVVAGIHAGAELHQHLDHVRHVDPSGVVQRRLVELH